MANEFCIPTQQEVAALPPEHVAALTAALLETYKGQGRVPYPVFKALGGVAVSPTLEVVPLRNNPNDGNVEVLLTQRPNTDEYWAGQWHVPGSSLLTTDEVEHDSAIDFDDENFNPIASFKSPIERLIAQEFGGTVTISGLFLVEARFRAGIRSKESTTMLAGEVSLEQPQEQPSVGRFFEVDSITTNPPEGGFIVGHASLIQRAAKMYANLQNS